MLMTFYDSKAKIDFVIVELLLFLIIIVGVLIRFNIYVLVILLLSIATYKTL